MGYLIYEGKTRQEAIDKMKLAAMQENRTAETHFIKATPRELKKWFGLKTEVRWNAIAYVSEREHVQAAKKTAAKVQEAPQNLFAREAEQRQPAVVNLNVTSKAEPKQQPVRVPAGAGERELQDKVVQLEQSLGQLQDFIRGEFNNIREGLVQKDRTRAVDDENRFARDVEIGKQNIIWAENFLREREFDLAVISEITEYLKKQKSDVLIDKGQILTVVRDYLKAHIKIEDISLDDYRFGRNVLFIGPTGVGKTVSLVKMAAHVAGARQKTCRFISIDRYKLGADAQLTMWAELMNAKCHPINEEKEFFHLLDLEDSNFTFIDTAGKSPRETIVIKELAEWVKRANRKFDTHLVISATTKPKDLDLIVQNYSMIEFNHIIATKLDETVCLGSILSVLVKTGKTLSFISNGQQVPMDFEIANVDKLIADSLK